jgi:hypothetical protein
MLLGVVEIFTMTPSPVLISVVDAVVDIVGDQLGLNRMGVLADLSKSEEDS